MFVRRNIPWSISNGKQLNDLQAIKSNDVGPKVAKKISFIAFFRFRLSKNYFCTQKAIRTLNLNKTLNEPFKVAPYSLQQLELKECDQFKESSSKRDLKNRKEIVCLRFCEKKGLIKDPWNNSHI